MQPIGPLMREHRLIERMIKSMKNELDKIAEKTDVNPNFIDAATDFLRTYADRCHHGKEEDILFRDLAKKSLSEENNKTMHELIQEHVYARKTVSSLISAKEGYVAGNKDSLKDILKLLKQLVELYPRHIEKEDKRFFYPCMKYFTKQEQDDMVQEFWEFDRKMIHEKYERVVDRIEQTQAKLSAKWRCRVCNYVYDPEKGDPENGIAPGILFVELPTNWVCPVCNASKVEFEKIE